MSPTWKGVVESGLRRIRDGARKIGLHVQKLPGEDPWMDMEPWARRIVERCRPFSMTSHERLYAVCKAVEYLVGAKIPGDFIECGVWRGGSAMAMGLTLEHLAARDRDLYLFDTYKGMPRPTDADVAVDGAQALDVWRKRRGSDGSSDWCRAGLDEVVGNLKQTEYPDHRIHCVKGLVEETIPGAAPHRVALLRLDTDWYASTKHELTHLYPRLVPKGVLIVDDYGHWQGARRAVDEYFAARDEAMLLARVDWTGRMGVKA